MTKRHILDMDIFSNIALLLAKRLGMRDRRIASPLEKQRELRSQIVEFSRSQGAGTPAITVAQRLSTRR